MLHATALFLLTPLCLTLSRTSTPSIPVPYKDNLTLLQKNSARPNANCGVYYNEGDAPVHLKRLFGSGRRVLLREWEDVEWRKGNGWKGTDLIHDPTGKGVCVRAYFWDKGGKTLTGIVEFGPGAESHRGLCHGGAMTSLFDDLAGHIVFIDGGESPWDGATVQVNCSLVKPIPVGAVLTIVGRVTGRERKKVNMSAEIMGEGGVVYAKMEGMSIQPVKMGADDAVGRRTWVERGDVLLDSGWNLP